MKVDSLSLVQKKPLILITVAAMAMSLAACSAGTSTDPDETAAPVVTQTAALPNSAALDAVKVEGKVGEEPKLDFAAPFKVDETQVKVIVPGDGAKVAAGGYILMSYYGVNARDGKVFDESWKSLEELMPSESATPSASPTLDPSASATPGATSTEPASSASATPSPSPSPKIALSAPISLKTVIPGLQKGVIGQSVGSRILIAIPSADAYTEGNEGAGIEPGDTLLFVLDIVKASFEKPTGTTQTPGEWAQKFKLTDSANGVTLNIPQGTTAPTDLVVETLIKGSGDAVAEADTIVSNYVGYSLKTGKVIEPWKTDDVAAVSSTLEGLKKALIGATVGSRLLVILPPAESFPEGNSDLGVAKGDAVLYVVDILFSTDFPPEYIGGE